MKNILNFIIFIIAIFCSCNSKNLRLKDLKFNNIEKDFIRINKIQESVISYDSSSFPKAKFMKNGQLNHELFITYCKEGYGTGVIKYDSNGNIIYHHINEFWGTTQRFQFDSLQLLINKEYFTDFSAEYTIKYHFDNKKFALYQLWTDGSETDTTIFLFNVAGYVTNETGHLHDDKDRNRTFIKDYFYKEDTLYKITTLYQNDYKELTKTEENFYFQKEKLSRIEISNTYSEKQKTNARLTLLKIVKKYDDRGLPIKRIEIYQGGITIVKLIKNNITTQQ